MLAQRQELVNADVGSDLLGLFSEEGVAVQLDRAGKKCRLVDNVGARLAGTAPELVKVAGVAPTELQELGGGSQSQPTT